MTAPRAALGRCIAEFYIARGLDDGSNEGNDYASAAYRPVNPFLDPEFSGNADLLDPDRWQPMGLRLFVDQAGNLADGIHEFVTPQWGRVVPFALGEDDLTVYKRAGADYHVYHDPGPPPTLGGPLAELYKWGFSLVGRWSSHLAPDDGATIDISPAGIGNVGALPQAFEDHRAFYDPVPWGPGHALNPATGRPYEPQWVPRGDYTRVLAEFWADGPDSETPPGHWFVILNTVSDHKMLLRRMGGEGPVLDPLEWDVKAYFTLGGAMHDAAVAAWGIKGWYDYIRPISALRAMAGRGQSSDPDSPSWSAAGPAAGPGGVGAGCALGPSCGRRGRACGQDQAARVAGTGGDRRSCAGRRRRRLDPCRELVAVPASDIRHPALCRLRVGPFDLFPCGGGGAGGTDRRSLLSRRHERVLHPRQPVPRVRARAIGRHDPAMGHLPGRGGSVQPVAHLGGDPPAGGRHPRPSDRRHDRTRCRSPCNFPLPTRS